MIWVQTLFQEALVQNVRPYFVMRTAPREEMLVQIGHLPPTEMLVLIGHLPPQEEMLVLIGHLSRSTSVVRELDGIVIVWCYFR